MARTFPRRDHDRIHLDREDLTRIPTLSDETLAKILNKRDFVHEELIEVDRELSRVVKALREASCAKYSRERNGSQDEAENASDDDGTICEGGFS
jgi:hypothetical protein